MADSFKGSIERQKDGRMRIRLASPDADLGSYVDLNEDDVRGHADLQGPELAGRSEKGDEVEVVLDRIEGDDVEGHASIRSDHNLKDNVVPVVW
jgi:hypothetical protein